MFSIFGDHCDFCGKQLQRAKNRWKIEDGRTVQLCPACDVRLERRAGKAVKEGKVYAKRDRRRSLAKAVIVVVILQTVGLAIALLTGFISLRGLTPAAGTPATPAGQSPQPIISKSTAKPNPQHVQ